MAYLSRILLGWSAAASPSTADIFFFPPRGGGWYTQWKLNGTSAAAVFCLHVSILPVSVTFVSRFIVAVKSNASLYVGYVSFGEILFCFGHWSSGENMMVFISLPLLQTQAVIVKPIFQICFTVKHDKHVYQSILTAFLVKNINVKLCVNVHRKKAFFLAILVLVYNTF